MGYGAKRRFLPLVCFAAESTKTKSLQRVRTYKDNERSTTITLRADRPQSSPRSLRFLLLAPYSSTVAILVPGTTCVLLTTLFLSKARATSSDKLPYMP